MESKIADIFNMEVAVVKTKYPQGAEKMLIKRVMNRHVPSGGLPLDVGCLVSNVSTAKAVSDAIQTGMPLVERVVTVTGERIARPGNFIVKTGTAVRDIVDYCGIIGDDVTIKLGGPMMGFDCLRGVHTPPLRAHKKRMYPETNTLPKQHTPSLQGGVVDCGNLDVPVIKGCNGIIAIETAVFQADSCIRCGRCVDVCPMELLPLYYPKYAAEENWPAMNEKNVRDCIECGCCQYICSSKIPLLYSIKAGKKGIAEMMRK
jgi:electron transport complex protein RnfC